MEPNKNSLWDELALQIELIEKVHKEIGALSSVCQELMSLVGHELEVATGKIPHEPDCGTCLAKRESILNWLLDVGEAKHNVATARKAYLDFLSGSNE